VSSPSSPRPRCRDSSFSGAFRRFRFRISGVLSISQSRSLARWSPGAPSGRSSIPACPWPYRSSFASFRPIRRRRRDGRRFSSSRRQQSCRSSSSARSSACAGGSSWGSRSRPGPGSSPPRRSSRRTTGSSCRAWRFCCSRRALSWRRISRDPWPRPCFSPLPYRSGRR
jgi:hypothetical protein